MEIFKDLGDLVAIGLGLLALATAAGFGLQRGRLSQQEKRIETLQGQLKDSDDELARKERRLTETQAEVTTLKTDLAALTRVVTGEAHWVAIGETLDLHHTRAETHWKRDEQILEEIRDLLENGRQTTTGGTS